MGAPADEIYRFLYDLKAGFADARDDAQVLRSALRATREQFAAAAACAAERGADGRLRFLFRLPRDGQWDDVPLTELLENDYPDDLPAHILVAVIRRRERPWAVLALRRDRPFERGAGRDLWRVTELLADVYSRIDHNRTLEIRGRLDRKIMEHLRPRDLFYQLLHAIRTLTGYDHSSALLMADEEGTTLELAAEQLACIKGKSHGIGRRFPLSRELARLMCAGGVFGFDRVDGTWREWHGRQLTPIVDLLGFNQEAGRGLPPERSMLCAPIATRAGVIGVLKAAALHPRAFGSYEAELLAQFAAQASVAIQYLQRTESLETRVLAAERKHVMANLARGVSHDINNALGSVLPIVQQLREEAASGAVDPSTLVDDLAQIEHSLQVSRRIFGGMLSIARGGPRSVGEGNLRRAIEVSIAVLADGFERRGIALELDVPENLPSIAAGQGDLAQLLLNLASNARDAMPRGGRLSVRAWCAAGQVFIEIADTGSGIAPEHLARVSEPFFTTKTDGSGLGLAICRSIVWTVHGDLRIESEPDTGTRVTVRLPTRETRDAATETQCVAP